MRVDYEVIVPPSFADRMERTAPGVIAKCQGRRARDVLIAEPLPCTLFAPYNVADIVESMLQGFGLAYGKVPRVDPRMQPWNSDDEGFYEEKGRQAALRLVDRGELTQEQADRLYSFQATGAGWIGSRPGALLEWVPGAGKTVGSLVGVLGATSRAVVISCPGGVRRQWEKAIRRFTTLVPWRQRVGKKRPKNYLELPDYLAWCRKKGQRAVLIVGHDGVNEIIRHLPAIDPGGLIIDEIHLLGSHKRWHAESDEDGRVSVSPRMTSGTNQISRAYLAMLLSQGTRRDPLNYDVRVGVTATPLDDGRPRRAWAQLDLILPHQFARKYRYFADRYCGGHQGEYGYDDSGSSHEDELKQRLQWIIHRLSRAQTHAALPPLRRELRLVEVADQWKGGRWSEAQTYHEAANAAAKRKAPVGEITEIRLAHACSLVRQQVITDAADEIEADGRVVIFATRQAEVESLRAGLEAELKRRHIDDAKLWVAHGGISEQKRDKAVTEYEATARRSCLIATGQSMGTGIDGMQYTTRALIAALPWKPGELIQWIGRFDRQGDLGRLCSTLVTLYVAAGSYAESILAALIEKMGSIERVLDGKDAAGLAAMLEGCDDEEAVLAQLVASASSLAGDLERMREEVWLA